MDPITPGIVHVHAGKGMDQCLQKIHRCVMPWPKWVSQDCPAHVLSCAGNLSI